MSRRKKSLVVYLTAGFPNAATFLKAVQVAKDSGADLLEVGLPFSDPVADGPVIQETSRRAISNGVDFDRTLNLSAKLPAGLPRVLMTYSNPLFVRGWANSFSQINLAGYSGCVIPDLPAEELFPLLPLKPNHEFYLVPFVAPTTSLERLTSVAAAARDGAFIYLVSLRGITGAKLSPGASHDLASVIAALRRQTHASIYVGFGVSSGADAARFAKISDGVIVGSAALKALTRGLKPFARLIAELRKSIDGVSE